MAYNPEADPRWIPPDTFAEVEELTPDDSAALSQLEAASNDLRLILDMMETQPWRLFMSYVDREKEQVDMRLRREVDQSNWKFVRGQSSVYAWLGDLPTELSKAQGRLNNQIVAMTEGERNA